MTTVRINIFNGFREQKPESFEVTGNIYQDIVTSVIYSGRESGQIYTIDGGEVNYDAQVIPGEYNYVIPEGKIFHFQTTNGLNKQIEHSKVKWSGKYRDVYNYLVAQGYPRGIRFNTSRGILNLDNNFNMKADGQEAAIYIIPPPTGEALPSQKVSISQVSIPQVSVSQVDIRVPGKGIVKVNTYQGKTTAGELKANIGGDLNNMKLAKVRRGEYLPKIYDDHTLVPKLTDRFENFYLIPDYETLLGAYSAMLQ